MKAIDSRHCSNLRSAHCVAWAQVLQRSSGKGSFYPEVRPNLGLEPSHLNACDKVDELQNAALRRRKEELRPRHPLH